MDSSVASRLELVVCVPAVIFWLFDYKLIVSPKTEFWPKYLFRTLLCLPIQQVVISAGVHNSCKRIAVEM